MMAPKAAGGKSIPVEINRKLYPLDIAMWRNESHRAGEYFSLSIKLKRQGDADMDSAFGR